MHSAPTGLPAATMAPGSAIRLTQRADGSWDGYAAKFSTAGRGLWKRYVGSTAGAHDDRGGICRGPAGGRYSAGETDSAGADPQGMVVKLRR